MESKSAVTKKVTKEEVIEKLKDCIRQRDPAFRKRFLDFSKEPNGKINAHDFRKVLEEHGMPMDDDQYALLTAKIGYKKEGMSYLDFATGFEDAAMNGPEATPPQTPGLSKGTSDSSLITAEECLRQFPRRLKEFFRTKTEGRRFRTSLRAGSSVPCYQSKNQMGRLVQEFHRDGQRGQRHPSTTGRQERAVRL